MGPGIRTQLQTNLAKYVDPMWESRLAKIDFGKGLGPNLGLINLAEDDFGRGFEDSLRKFNIAKRR